MTVPPWKNQPVPFARFMQWCLYDPELGYYRNRGRFLGNKGDFYTAPHAHEAFAALLANYAGTRLQRFPEGPLQLVELGAGDETLGRRLMSELARRRPALAERLQYWPVEVDSRGLPESIRGMVFSNEFFDALPVHRVRVRGARLREFYVVFRDGGFAEFEDELSDSRIEDFMRSFFPVWREGAVYEVSLQALEILQDLDQRIDQAVALTIDYGYDWKQYDSRERPEGTLMCYRRHQAHADPYLDVGRQDITSHVNFEALVQTGRALGWKDRPLQTQRQFLMDCGLAELLAAEEREGLFNPARLEQRLGLKRLLEPGGISDLVQVLVQEVRLQQPADGPA